MKPIIATESEQPAIYATVRREPVERRFIRRVMRLAVASEPISWACSSAS